MEWHVIEDNPLGTKTVFHYDHAAEEFYIEDVEDVHGTLEENKGLSQLDTGNWQADRHHVAQIPEVVWADLVKRGIAQDDKALLRWLDDPDNRLFRTKHGRLSR